MCEPVTLSHDTSDIVCVMYTRLRSYLSTVLLQAAAGTELGTEAFSVEWSRASVQTGKGISSHIAS
jgi:hypothetical protein